METDTANDELITCNLIFKKMESRHPQTLYKVLQEFGISRSTYYRQVHTFVTFILYILKNYSLLLVF